MPPELIAFENAVMKDLRAIGPATFNTFHNISRAESCALMELSNDNSITIKSADKDGPTVIMNNNDYDNECLRLLSDGRTYQRLAKDPTADLKVTIISMTDIRKASCRKRV